MSEKMLPTEWDEAYLAGFDLGRASAKYERNKAIQECVGTVRGMPCESSAPESEWVNKWKVLSALLALLEKP